MAAPMAYSSFLVRVWHRPTEPPAEVALGDSEWLVQVELIPSGERQYFASLGELFAFLENEINGEWDRSGES